MNENHLHDKGTDRLLADIQATPEPGPIVTSYIQPKTPIAIVQLWMPRSGNNGRWCDETVYTEDGLESEVDMAKDGGHAYRVIRLIPRGTTPPANGTFGFLGGLAPQTPAEEEADRHRDDYRNNGPYGRERLPDRDDPEIC
jgi:hypothetical protein